MGDNVSKSCIEESEGRTVLWVVREEFLGTLNILFKNEFDA